MVSLIAPILLALFFISIGILSEKYPTIITGYSDLSDEKKKTFPALLRKTSVITGIIIVLGSFVSYLLESRNGSLLFLITPPAVMVIFLLIMMNRKDRNKNSQ